jgi:hypothetical protein
MRVLAGRGASMQAFPRRAWEREKKSDFFKKLVVPTEEGTY